MASVLSSRVLVLNRSFMPIHIIPLRHALAMLYRGIAKVVDEQYELFDFISWSHLSVEANDEKIGLVNKVIRAPRVILLQLYDRLPKRTVRFSRINIYLRDKNTCQYCGKLFPRSNLNLDHVVPVSQGGKSTWENVVCSCIECNLKKGGNTPQGAGMYLIKKPVKPPWSFLFNTLSRPVFYDEWKPFLNVVDYSYWNTEILE